LAASRNFVHGRARETEEDSRKKRTGKFSRFPSTTVVVHVPGPTEKFECCAEMFSQIIMDEKQKEMLFASPFLIGIFPLVEVEGHFDIHFYRNCPAIFF
jgi:hypothetical protein